MDPQKQLGLRRLFYTYQTALQRIVRGAANILYY